MGREAFPNRVKKVMSEKVPRELTGGLWKNKPYPHIYLDMKDNFIDGKYPTKCDVKGNYFGKDIGYHEGIASLNSSQAVCINFFKKFFENEEWEPLLIDALKAVGVPLDQEKISNAIFEYVPNPNENTNFDFYVRLDSGCHISMEIKYTEPEFGSANSQKDPEKYERKWNEIYKNLVNKCPYIQCDKEAFLEHYQINRNISYAKEGDIVLFVTPRANDERGIVEGREHIESFYNPRILNIYWEDLVDALMKIIVNEPELLAYYGKFKDKYISILEEKHVSYRH